MSTGTLLFSATDTLLLTINILANGYNTVKLGLWFKMIMIISLAWLCSADNSVIYNHVFISTFENLPTCRSEVVKNVDALFGKVSTDSFSSISQIPCDHPKFSHFGMNTYSTLVLFFKHIHA